MATVEIDIVGRDNFSGVLGNFGSIITGIESGIRLAGDAFRAFAGFAMEGLDAIASYERMSATFETLAAKELLAAGGAQSMAEAIGLSGDRAEELLGWVQEIAIKSPFTQEGVALALRTAMAYGFTSDEAQRLTEAMINFAAGSGASETVMSQIALALGQIEAKGKLAGQEVLQLVNAGLPVTQILADAFNVTTAEIEEMREKGLIPAKDAIEAITVYLETNFAGAAERQANTWAGLQGTFEDLKQMGLREFFGGLFDVIQPLAVEFSTWLQGPGMEKLSEWGRILGEFTQKVINLGESIASGEFDFSDMFNRIDDLLITGINAIDWRAVGDAFGDAIEASLSEEISGNPTLASSIGHALSEFFLGAIGEIDWSGAGQALDDSLNAFFVDLLNINEIKAGWQQIGEDLINGISVGMSDGIDGLIANATNFWRNIINNAKAVFGIASPSTVFAQIGRDIISGLIGGFTGMAGTLLAVVGNIVDDVVSAFQPVIDIVTGGDGSMGGQLGTQTDTRGTTGTTGSGAPGSPAPGTTTGSGMVINQYFAGATINVGSWEEIDYDCIFPNPFISAGSGQLGTGGSGGGFKR